MANLPQAVLIEDGYLGFAWNNKLKKKFPLVQSCLRFEHSLLSGRSLFIRTENKSSWYWFKAQVMWCLAEAMLISSEWTAFNPRWCCWSWWQHDRAVKTRSISLSADCGFGWKGWGRGLGPLLQTVTSLFPFACLLSLISECCVPSSCMLTLLALCQRCSS